jgi:hypothetical protein
MQKLNTEKVSGSTLIPQLAFELRPHPNLLRAGKLKGICLNPLQGLYRWRVRPRQHQHQAVMAARSLIPTLTV